MRKYGLIGYPLGHSFSKKYFSEKFLYEHIPDSSYENYPLSNIDELPGLIGSDDHLMGLNVTIPYKTEIFRFLDIIDPEASAIGAVNVVKIRRENGRITLTGYNSDVTGIRDTLGPFMGDNVRNALILGTGGSSKAVRYVLEKAGINVVHVSRKKKTGYITYSEIDSELIRNSTIIVNTTPLGMFPDISTKPDISYNELTPGNILFDLVYNPEFTAFLRAGAEHGCITLSGLKMLHSQAEKAWEIWNNDTL
jgi:shikimate dehydrogenase